MSNPTKTCSTCGGTFPLTREFYGQRAPTGSFRARCRACDRREKARYAEDNPLQVREKWQRQNARRQAAGRPWSAADVAAIRHKLKDRCFYCGTALFGGGEVDHMTSLEAGGTHEFSNLTLACRACNRAKGGMNAREFMAWRRSRGEYCREVFWPTQEDMADVLKVLDRMVRRLDRIVPEQPRGGKILQFRRR